MSIMSVTVVLLLTLFFFLSTPSQAQNSFSYEVPGPAMFRDITANIISSTDNPSQLNYGIAVTDVDNDGQLEVVVAGYNGPNLVLKYNKATRKFENIAVNDPASPYYELRNPEGNAIGVCACDVDGDGKEEIYFLNTNQAYSGMATYSDKLFKMRNGRYEDILSDNINRNIASFFAGRSVACVDRNGNGKYAVYLANYARGSTGPHSLIEMDESRSNVSEGIVALRNVAEEAGVNKLTGGRGVSVGPIVSKEGRSDIFCDNEHGKNFLFRNNGDGTFTDIATEAGVADGSEHGRGVMLTDFNGDGLIDIVYGNWNGPHRMFLQTTDDEGHSKFKNIATEEFSQPSPIRTVIAADFNNDGNLEVMMNNIAYRGRAPNRLFTVTRRVGGMDPLVTEINIGDALEVNGRGTGGAVTDIDGDGKLELILSHGESAEQPLSFYRLSESTETVSNHWMRVRVLTQHGAPARGAKVMLYGNNTGAQTRVIDAGSGYLCQMEPVAHFGLKEDTPVRLEVTWPDTSFKALDLKASDLNKEIIVSYPVGGQTTSFTGASSCGAGWQVNTTTGRCEDTDECECDCGTDCPEGEPQCASVCAPAYRCTNTIGDYACTPDIDCQEGFQPTYNFTCEDVDECATMPCDQNCHNTAGSYYCSCRGGYRRDELTQTCEDINECTEGTHQCDHICHNNIGGYHCHCNSGYVLQSNRVSCMAQNP